MRILICIVALLASSLAQSRPGAPVKTADQPGRYQLIAAKAPDLSKGGSVQLYEELFLCDTLTGRVWKVSPSMRLGEEGEEEVVSAYLKEMVVDGLHGSIRDEVKAAAKRAVDSRQQKWEEESVTYCKGHPAGSYKAWQSSELLDCSTVLQTILKLQKQ